MNVDMWFDHARKVRTSGHLDKANEVEEFAFLFLQMENIATDEMLLNTALAKRLQRFLDVSFCHHIAHDESIFLDEMTGLVSEIQAQIEMVIAWQAFFIQDNKRKLK